MSGASRNGIILLSLGHPVGDSYKNDPLCQAVESAWNSSIVIVCAAGNNGRASAINTSGAANEGWGTAYGSKAISGSKALSGSSVWTDKALSGSSSTAVDLSMVALKGE